MGELEEILNTYKRFPDVPLVLGDPEARLLIAALEEARELLRYWGQSHRCYYPTREAGVYCCRICKYREGAGHDPEANCIIGRTENFIRAAEDQCD